MFQSGRFEIQNNDIFRRKIITWLEQFEVFCLLDSNTASNLNHRFSYSGYDFIVAAGVNSEISSQNKHSLNDLDKACNINNNWHFGFLSYDLKNKFENLSSNNIDFLNWPDFYFFNPEIILLIRNSEAEILVSGNSKFKPFEIWKQLSTLLPKVNNKNTQQIEVKARMEKQEYINRVNNIKNRIHRGDLYEINFCQEYYTYCNFNPFERFLKLNKISPTPFSSFFRLGSKYLLCASPERYLKKIGKKILSQPIKGTTRRGNNPADDQRLIDQMRSSSKEKSENIMIVDLVRNDLSRISEKNSVKVEELCGVYSFRQVHQMISTISAYCNTNSIEEILKSTFPMGSMTGAPKIKAMQLAEEFETTKRGLYSGAVGYITPNKDFDFNVVIRSLQYNEENKYLSYMVGGAITSLSEAEKEYEECLIKALALEQLLTNEQ